jgi:phosphopantetheine--protein transferase-like protein
MSEPIDSQLKAMLAPMLAVAPDEIHDGTSLASLNTSLGSAKVRLGLKRLGLALPAGSANAATFGGLVAAVSGGETAAIQKSPVALQPTAGNFSGLQVGLDVEDIGALPVVGDYWEDAFYRDSFAKSEIAYAVLQAEPRTHFAGFWCAKEALRKCDAAFASVALNQIAVAHELDGRPYLMMQFERLGHAVSISHTAEVATAVVVSGSAAPEVVVEAIAPLMAEAIVPEARKSRGLARLFKIG